jgi:putative FmdB family regulatory protein
MPFYEYRCQNCGRRNSLFKVSIAEAEAAQTGLRCERCGSPALQRLLSRFSLGKAPRSEGEDIYEFDRLTAGLDEDNPARWAESLSDIDEPGSGASSED